MPGDGSQNQIDMKLENKVLYQSDYRSPQVSCSQKNSASRICFKFLIYIHTA